MYHCDRMLSITRRKCISSAQWNPRYSCLHLFWSLCLIASSGWDIQGVKNYVYNVSGMIEEVKTKVFYLTKLGLCTVLPLDGLTGRWLDFRHNKHRLVLFVLLSVQQVERVITMSTNTCYDKYSKYVCIYYLFSSHSILTVLKRVYVCTTWRFPFVVVHWTQLIHHRWLGTL